MERFRPALRRVAGELDLPRRARTELLLELASDLVAVYEHHRSRGLTEDEAAGRAEAAVLGSTEVIRRLGRLHVSPWRGWADELSARLRGGWALFLLAVGVLPVVATAVAVSAWVMARQASPFAWAVLLLGGLLAAVATRDVIRLSRDRPPAGYLPTILVLSAMAPAVGVLAPIIGLQRAVALESRHPNEAVLLTSLAQELATFLAGLLVGLGGLLVWFVLLELEGRRAAEEIEALLAEDGSVAARPAPLEGDFVIPLVGRRQG